MDRWLWVGGCVHEHVSFWDGPWRVVWEVTVANMFVTTSGTRARGFRVRTSAISSIPSLLLFLELFGLVGNAFGMPFSGIQSRRNRSRGWVVDEVGREG